MTKLDRQPLTYTRVTSPSTFKPISIRPKHLKNQQYNCIGIDLTQWYLDEKANARIVGQSFAHYQHQISYIFLHSVSWLEFGLTVSALLFMQSLKPWLRNFTSFLKTDWLEQTISSSSCGFCQKPIMQIHMTQFTSFQNEF